MFWSRPPSWGQASGHVKQCRAFNSTTGSTEREVAKRRDPQVVTVEWHRAVVELFVVRIARKIGNSGRRSPGAGAATYVVSFGRRGWRMEARTFLSTTSCWRSF